MIYENIRNLREDRDLRQKDLAAMLNVSQNTYSQLSNREQTPPAIKSTPSSCGASRKERGTGQTDRACASR